VRRPALAAIAAAALAVAGAPAAAQAATAATTATPAAHAATATATAAAPTAHAATATATRAPPGATATTATPAATAAASRPPAISAQAGILVQPDTEDVPFRRASTRRLPIASTTKLMTALVTLEHEHDLDRTVTAAEYDAAPAESLMGLRAGERVTIRDLVRGLLLASGNDAAHTLAVRVGGTQANFVRMMNRRARALGLTDTHYTNPVGLDEGRNYSSAQDLAKLALILLQNPFFAKTVDSPSATVTSGGRTRTLLNRNTLVRQVPWVDGVKTGHTNLAGYVLVGAASRKGVRLVSVVIDDPSEAARDADSLALLKWGLRQYRTATILPRGKVMARPKLDYRDDATVDVVAARTVRMVIRRSAPPTIRVSRIPAELKGPLKRGQQVGTATISRNGKVVATVPLVTRAAVPAASTADKVSHALPPIWAIGLVVAALACSLPLALRHRRRVRRRRARAGRSGGTETA
jgi:D-alanyl-D-alanine carboxypeptidase (penicillin-binding protein 5/6)